MDTFKQKYLTASEEGSWHRTLPIAVVAATWLISASSAGAVEIQSIQLGSLNNTGSTTTNGVTYLGQSQSIISFRDANNTNWVLTGGPASTTLYLRRSGTGASNRQVVFGRQLESDNTGNTVLPPAPTPPNDTTQSVLSQNNIFSGTDNLFANTGSNRGNFSDVERVDFIFNQSVSPANNLGVTVFERGISHDSFRIAAITGLGPDNSTPTGYGTLLTFNSWGTTGLTGNYNYTILNTANDPNPNDNTNVFAASDRDGVVQQNIGGVVIPLTDLVPSVNTTIYGYSLFALSDVSANATSSDLVNFANFPTDTSQASNAGGIDLLAANIGVVRGEPVPFKFSPSLGLLILGATWGAKSLWQRHRIKRFNLS